MNILCWNIQKNSDKTISDAVALALSTEISGFTSNSFALFILENKSGPDVVGNRIKDAIGKNAQASYFQMGGNTHRAENVICIHSNDVRVARSELFTKWKPVFEGILSDETNRISNNHTAQASEARDRYAIRQPRPELEFKSLSADDLRSPVIYVLKTATEEHKVAVVHSPGPGAKTEVMAQPEAKLYFDAVMSTLRNEVIDVVVGDFNIYSINSEPDGFTQQNSGPTPTTYGTGKLDRVFVKGAPKCHAYVFGPDTKPEYTDHRGIGLRVVDPKAWMASSVVDMLCAKCGEKHGSWISVLRRWHECEQCGTRYCYSCGWNLPRLAGLRALMPNRICSSCKGETRMLS